MHIYTYIFIYDFKKETKTTFNLFLFQKGLIAIKDIVHLYVFFLNKLDCFYLVLYYLLKKTILSTSIFNTY